MARLQGSVAALADQLRALSTDHETRLRRLERYAYAVPVSALAAIGAALAAILGHH
jgi:hypothetical protein